MVSPSFDRHRHFPGAIVFDGTMAMKVCYLNNICRSFNESENRCALKVDLEAYMEKYGHLNEAWKEAVRPSKIHCLAQPLDAGPGLRTSRDQPRRNAIIHYPLGAYEAKHEPAPKKFRRNATGGEIAGLRISSRGWHRFAA